MAPHVLESASWAHRTVPLVLIASRLALRPWDWSSALPSIQDLPLMSNSCCKGTCAAVKPFHGGRGWQKLFRCLDICSAKVVPEAYLKFGHDVNCIEKLSFCPPKNRLGCTERFSVAILNTKVVRIETCCCPDWMIRSARRRRKTIKKAQGALIYY